MKGVESLQRVQIFQGYQLRVGWRGVGGGVVLSNKKRENNPSPEEGSGNEPSLGKSPNSPLPMEL